MPRPFVGDALLPLNRLAEWWPEVAARHRRKYVGRETLLERPVPPLGCLWNDVLHLSPVPIERVRDALLAEGLSWPRGGREVAVIEPDRVGMTDANTALWFSPPGPRVTLRGTPDEYAPYDPGVLAGRREVPRQTQDHYRAFAAEGRRPFLFHGITHVLFRGAVPLSAVTVVRV